MSAKKACCIDQSSPRSLNADEDLYALSYCPAAKPKTNSGPMTAMTIQRRRLPSEGLMTNASKEISGSSVATAIAAGMASLVFACCLYASEKENHSRKQQIEIFFGKMQSEENRRHDLKYVEPAIIFGEKSIAGKILKDYIKDMFGRS